MCETDVELRAEVALVGLRTIFSSCIKWLRVGRITVISFYGPF